MRKSLPILLLCFFIFNTAEAQHRIGLGSSLQNSEYIPSLQYELQLGEKWSFSARGSYYIDTNTWFGPDDNPYRNARGYMQTESEQRSDGLGVGFGMIRSNFILKNLSLQGHLDFYSKDTRWALIDSFIYDGHLVNFDYRLSESVSVKSINPSIGLGYTIHFTGQFFIQPAIRFGKEYIVTDVDQIDLENQRTKTFSILIGTSF